MSESGMGAAENEELTNILYLSIVFGLIEVIVIYGKFDFLNVTHD
jgi:hypothetical protein